MSSNRDIGVQLHTNGDYWQAVWYDSHGRRKRRGLGRRKECGGDVSERQAKRECSKIANDLATSPGRRDQTGAVRLGEWCDRFDELRSDLSDESRRLYRDAAKLMRERWGDDRKIDSITHLEAAEFATHLLKTYPNESTHRKYMRHCKGIFAKARKLHLIAVNPFDGVASSPPDVDKDWQTVSRDDVEKVIAVAPTVWRALIGLLRYAGLRRGEALRLGWQHIDFERRVIKVRSPGGKRTTKHRDRDVPMDPRLHELLLERFEACEPGEKPVALATDNFDDPFKTLIKRAGLEPWPKLCHTLRKNRQAEWSAIYPIMDVAEWLGNSPTIAFKHYHKTQEHVLDRVTGRATEADELVEAKAEIAMLRARCRRLIRAARAKT